jgi:hypothetical protein
MIFNVKIHRKEVFFIVRNWSFDNKTIFVYSNIGIRCFMMVLNKSLNMTVCNSFGESYISNYDDIYACHY